MMHEQEVGTLLSREKPIGKAHDAALKESGAAWVLSRPHDC